LGSVLGVQRALPGKERRDGQDAKRRNLTNLKDEEEAACGGRGDDMNVDRGAGGGTLAQRLAMTATLVEEGMEHRPRKHLSSASMSGHNLNSTKTSGPGHPPCTTWWNDFNYWEFRKQIH
jgi:hypothetical protein